MTDNDRELIELAAKAIGYTLKGWNNDHDGKTLGVGDWNPLTSDGDAFRLAVQLKIWILFEQDTWATAESGGMGYNVKLGDDHGAATRRAIVRAAASAAFRRALLRHSEPQRHIRRIAHHNDADDADDHQAR